MSPEIRGWSPIRVWNLERAFGESGDQKWSPDGVSGEFRGSVAGVWSELWTNLEIRNWSLETALGESGSQGLESGGGFG